MHGPYRTPENGACPGAERFVMEEMMERKEKIELLETARKSIEDAFKGIALEEFEDDARRNGAFVTLRKGSSLRGCIGYIIGLCGLKRQIALLARDAAFSDYRFPPLSESELPLCTIEISLLTKPERIAGPLDFTLHRDGIIMVLGGRRAVFLPQVADETGWTKEEMLSALSEKAGLPPSAWRSDEAAFLTFQAEVFSEDDL